MISFFVSGLAETKGSWRAIAPGVVKPDNPREKAWVIGKDRVTREVYLDALATMTAQFPRAS